MRNPRSITLTPQHIQELSLNTSPPPPDSLFWLMWKAAAPLAQKALGTEFLQGIKNGNLDPVTYGRYCVSDAYYCYHGADDYGAAAERATNPTAQAFLALEQKHYNSYNATFPGQWRIKDAQSLLPLPQTLAYTEFESNCATHKNPLYTIIAMLPCEYLWAWLAAQLKPYEDNNPYGFWIKANDYPDGAYAMGNFLQQFISDIDPATAIQIYSAATKHEYLNFECSKYSP